MGAPQGISDFFWSYPHFCANVWSFLKGFATIVWVGVIHHDPNALWDPILGWGEFGLVGFWWLKIPGSGISRYLRVSVVPYRLPNTFHVRRCHLNPPKNPIRYRLNLSRYLEDKGFFALVCSRFFYWKVTNDLGLPTFHPRCEWILVTTSSFFGMVKKRDPLKWLENRDLQLIRGWSVVTNWITWY